MTIGIKNKKWWEDAYQSSYDKWLELHHHSDLFLACVLKITWYNSYVWWSCDHHGMYCTSTIEVSLMRKSTVGMSAYDFCCFCYLVLGRCLTIDQIYIETYRTHISSIILYYFSSLSSHS